MKRGVYKGSKTRKDGYKRKRICYFVDEKLVVAIKKEAKKHKVTCSQVVEDILRGELMYG